MRRAQTKLEIEEFAEALGLGAAYGDLCLFLVIHAELVSGFKPRDDFSDLIDVDDEAAVCAPEDRRIELIQEFLDRSALGLALELMCHDANDALIDFSEADFGLIDEQESAARLHYELGGVRGASGSLRIVSEQVKERINLGFDG